MAQISVRDTVVPLDLTSRPSASTDFETFYRAESHEIGRALALTIQNPELAEDALNEAMTRALLAWKTVRNHTNPAGWVYRTAMNWAYSWLRRRRRERDRPFHERATESFTHVEPGLADALARLSVDQRAVVVCRFQLDWSIAETAAALDVAEGTVKSRLSRALEQIRADMGVSINGSEDA